MKKRIIPRRNYIILIGLMALVTCACFAFYNLYQILEENKINKSPLASKQVLYDELKSTTFEMNADSFLVISYTQNKEVHANEKQIKKYLNKNNLIDNVMYLDAVELMNDKNFLLDLNKTLKLDNNLEVKALPAVIFYKDGNATYKIDSHDHLLNRQDFEQIVDMYELTS